MSDQHDPETADDYDRLRDSVVATTDVEASLEDLHSRVGGAHRARRRWTGAVGAAAAAALIAGAAFVFTRTDSTDVTAAGDPTTTASSTPADTTVQPTPAVACPAHTFIYMVPGASTEQVQGMHSTLESLDLEPYEFLDREASAEEFRRIFADQPDFVAAIDPSELPESFRLPETLPAQTITAIEGTPGFLRIESGDATCTPAPAAADSATTTSIAGG
jgi:hypothetical protein